MAEPKPRAPVRRFDVFAEYNRLKALNEEGLNKSKPKGYGLWLAQVVAAQKFGRMPKPERKKKPETPEEKREREKRERTEWHDLSGVPQTDKLFDQEIVNRMGKDFYQKVFSPAIQQAYTEGKPYVAIRDSIRKDWKPE